MRSWIVVAAAALFSCSAQKAPEQPVSACSVRSFEGSRFTVCNGGGKVEVRTGFRSFAQLQAKLGHSADRVSFAMNGGMFDDQGKPIGLLVEDGRQVHAINLREGGGNFHLMPNGVFLVRKSGRAEVVPSKDYKTASDIAFATQSGPMLVIDGKLHPKFDPDGTSRYVRNGVGIAPGGHPMFVISDDAVSFGKFARFFRDVLKTRNALYFDGSVSSLWDPANARMDSFTELGPMVVVFKGAESKPGPAAPATP